MVITASVASSKRSNFQPTGSLLTLPPFDLPDSHDGVVFFGEANSVDLYRSGIAIIPKFKDVA